VKSADEVEDDANFEKKMEEETTLFS